MVKTTEKFDFKAEAKKWWNAVVRFVKPYKNLDKEVLAPYFEPFLKKNINMVYTVGSLVLLVFAVFALRFFPYFSAIFAQWLIIFVIFVIFRLLCELIADGNAPKSNKK